MQTMDVEDVGQFVAGLELARDIVEQLGIRDPARLQEAADQLEDRAVSDLERGCAVGYRLIAEDLEDGLL
jgi:hypothetical protein